MPSRIRSAARAHLAADRVQLVTDAAHGVAVHRTGQRGERFPRVGRRVVRVERPERRVELARDPFAAADVDLSVARRPAAAAAHLRHPLLHRTPQVGGRVVLFNGVDIGRHRNVAGAETSAQDVDFSVHRAGHRMVARRRHRAPFGPRVGRRVVHLIAAGDPRSLPVLQRLETTDQINLSIDLLGDRRTSLDGQRCERAP